MTRIASIVLMLAVAIGAISDPTRTLAQQQSRPAPRGILFLGRVESVDPGRKVVTVKHPKIPGYADTGTGEYSTDTDDDLKRLQPGDDIRATVYPNDLTLHKIQIAYRRPAGKGKMPE